MTMGNFFVLFVFVVVVVLRGGWVGCFLFLFLDRFSCSSVAGNSGRLTRMRPQQQPQEQRYPALVISTQAQSVTQTAGIVV